MKKEFNQTIALAALLALTGCETTGLSTRERAGISYPAYVMGLRPNSAEAAPRKMKFPMQLAVVEAGESAPAENLLKKLESQKALITSVAALPAPADSAREAVPAGELGDPVDQYSVRVNSLCDLARSAGADYLFLYGGNIDYWRTANALKFFDITLVGAYVVPSTGIKAEGKAAGVLIDVTTRTPVLFVSAEARDSSGGASELAYSKQQNLVTAVRDQLSAKLADELLARFASHDLANENHVDCSSAQAP